MTELADLDPLRNLTKLTHLVLLENPITRKEVSILYAPFLCFGSELLHIWVLPSCLISEWVRLLIFTALPVLGHLEDPQRALPGLPEDKGCRA